VDTWVWHKVGLELGDVHVKSTIESERSGQGRTDLSKKTVEVGVGWALNVEVAAAHVVESLVVHAEGHISVLKESVGGEHRVVWLDHSVSHLRSWGDSERDLGLAAVIDGEALEEERSETGASSATSCVVAHESLEASAVVSELSDAVEYEVDDLLANGVVATSVVVSCVLLAGDDLLRVVELAVGASADFVTHSWLEVNVDSARDVLASTSLGEEGVESIIATTDGLVGRHLAIWLDAVLEAVKLPASIACLDTSLADVDVDYFTHV